MNPSLALIPSAYKAGKLYSVLPEDGTGDFTVSRNGTATRVNKAGLIESVAANVPRLEFDPVTGEFLGVLVEDAATNLISGDVIGWNRQNILNIILESNTFPSNPNQNSYKIIPDTSNNQHRIFDFANVGDCNYSILAKADGYNFISLALAGGLAGSSIIFNLSNGTFSGSEGGIIPFIEQYEDGWYYIGFSKASTLLNASRWIIVRNENNINNYIGDGTSGVLVFNPQITEGLDLKSRIFNEGLGQVTRPADIITVTIQSGATEVVYVNNGVQTTLPVTAGDTFQLPVGVISKLWMN